MSKLVDLDPGNLVWQGFLKDIKSVKGSKKDSIEKLKAIAAKANASPHLTFRQRQGIVDRVEYQINLLSHPEGSRGNHMSDYMQGRQNSGA